MRVDAVMKLSGLANEIFEHVRGLPIISPHGHVDPALLLGDRPLGEPTSALIRPDHYVTRLIRTHGFDYEELCYGHELDFNQGEAIFLDFARYLANMAGTTVAFWLDEQLKDNFLLSYDEVIVSPKDAYARLSEALFSPAFRPSEILNRAKVAVLATTDSYSSDLSVHSEIAWNGQIKAKVRPAFRPEGLFDIAQPTWDSEVGKLGAASDLEIKSFADIKEGLKRSLDYFVANGALSIDISPKSYEAHHLEDHVVEDIVSRRLGGGVNALSMGDAKAFMEHMTYLMVEFACEFALPITIHPGIFRNHHLDTYSKYGSDKGSDIPRQVLVTDALFELLNRFGNSPNLKLILFTVDETIYSRELAPLAGFYPSVFIGYPWWFIDSPQGLHRFFDAVVPQVGFYKLSGFIDDTRALLSIPIRHKMARSSEAEYLATLVQDGYLTEERAFGVAEDLVTTIPSHCFSIKQ